MATDVSLLQPQHQHGKPAVQTPSTVQSELDTDTSSKRLADAPAQHELLVHALVQLYAPVTLSVTASIVHQLYPDLEPIEIGKILLTPGVFPDISAAQMQGALLSTGFAPAAVVDAIKALYPTPPAQEPFATIATSMQGGNRGIELWVACPSGQVWTLYQLIAGGAWSHWEGPGFVDQPEAFTSIAASEQQGNRSVELWGIGACGQVWTLYQTTAGDSWSHWEDPGFKRQPAPMKKIAAALQNNSAYSFGLSTITNSGTSLRVHRGRLVELDPHQAATTVLICLP